MQKNIILYYIENIQQPAFIKPRILSLNLIVKLEPYSSVRIILSQNRNSEW